MKKILSFLGGLTSLLFTTMLFAQEHAAAAGAGNQAYYAIGAAIAIGIAVLGGTLGQGKAASAALEGIARNPGSAGKVQVPMILGLALIESLVLFAFLIANTLAGKL